ncbi:MAG: hypothetical protein ACR2IJ_07890 [Fluviibacter sp.]
MNESNGEVLHSNFDAGLPRYSVRVLLKNLVAVVFSGMERAVIRVALLALVAAMLSGCAAPLQLVADHFNAQDPCQKARQARPAFCGAGGATAMIRGPDGRVMGTVWPMPRQ